MDFQPKHVVRDRFTVHRRDNIDTTHEVYDSLTNRSVVAIQFAEFNSLNNSAYRQTEAEAEAKTQADGVARLLNSVTLTRDETNLLGGLLNRECDAYRELGRNAKTVEDHARSVESMNEIINLHLKLEGIHA